MKSVKLLISGLVVISGAIPTLAQSSRFENRTGGSAAADVQLDRAQFLRMAQQFARQVSETERLARIEASSYRPNEQRALQMLRNLFVRANDITVAARNVRPGGLQRVRMLVGEAEAIAQRTDLVLERVNFSVRVDRQYAQSQATLRQLSIEVRRLERGDRGGRGGRDDIRIRGE